MPANSTFDQLLDEAFSIGRLQYGDIGLSGDSFVAYVWSIVFKHLGEGPSEDSVIDFVKRLHLRDLYLVCGCVRESQKAWLAMDICYRKFVTDLVRFSYRNGADAEEVADCIVVSLYMPDRSGHHRIASYDGRSSLATWLRVIVANRAINDSHNGRISYTGTIPDIPDRLALLGIELTLRERRYRRVLRDSLTCAFSEITTRERLMLLWRYEEEMQLGEIAKLLGIHQSNVTRQLNRLTARLRSTVVAILSSKHQLSTSAIQECLADILENPRHTISLMSLIKEGPKSTSAVPFSGASEKLASRSLS
jgi:RNA polymerase sigma-70 factor